MNTHKDTFRESSDVALSEGMRDVLKKLATSDILPSKTYLAGGTATALYLGHRLSIDLDFFSDEEFNTDTVLENLRKYFTDLTIEIAEEKTLICQIITPEKQVTRFSLFHYPYPLIEHFLELEIKGMSGPLRIADIPDIIAMKAVAIVQRGSAKDFVDLYFLMNHTDIQITELYSLVRKKYSLEENYLYHINTALSYFDDAEKEINEIVLVDPGTKKAVPINAELWEEIKTFFTNIVGESHGR